MRAPVTSLYEVRHREAAARCTWIRFIAQWSGFFSFTHSPLCFVFLWWHDAYLAVTCVKHTLVHMCARTSRCESSTPPVTVNHVECGTFYTLETCCCCCCCNMKNNDTLKQSPWYTSNLGYINIWHHPLTRLYCKRHDSIQCSTSCRPIGWSTTSKYRESDIKPYAAAWHRDTLLHCLYCAYNAVIMVRVVVCSVG